MQESRAALIDVTKQLCPHCGASAEAESARCRRCHNYVGVPRRRPLFRSAKGCCLTWLVATIFVVAVVDFPHTEHSCFLAASTSLESHGFDKTALVFAQLARDFYQPVTHDCIGDYVTVEQELDQRIVRLRNRIGR